jgi:hypothetical protein
VLGGVAGILVAARAFKAKWFGRKKAAGEPQDEAAEESTVSGDS